MSWFYLIIAGIFEVGWPVGLRLAQNSNQKMLGISIAVICMLFSGMLLYIAQKSIPMGIAYAVWTGIGIVGTFLVCVIWFNEPNSFASYCGIVLILTGIILLKIANTNIN
jgi:quaternary ammonium compound-resistance protein SugE